MGKTNLDITILPLRIGRRKLGLKLLPEETCLVSSGEYANLIKCRL